MRQVCFGIAIAMAATLALSSGADAQIVKGAGKLGITVMRVDPITGAGTLNAKAAGAMAVKPVATVVGKPPTGGAVTSFKLAKDIMPTAPGFPPGEYVIEFETAQTTTGDTAGPGGITTFATLTVDPLGKCTIHAHASVLTGSGSCGGMSQPLCSPDTVGKCTISTYQIAGATNYLLAPGAGQPTAQRVRIRKLGDASDCKTGDVLAGGAPLIGGTTCHSASNPVFAVVGVAGGTIN